MKLLMENWRRFLLKEDLTIDNNFYDDVNRWAQTKRSGLEQLGVKVSPAGEADTLTVLFADLEPKLTKIRQIGSELSPAFHLEFENVDKEELAPLFSVALCKIFLEVSAPKPKLNAKTFFLS